MEEVDWLYDVTDTLTSQALSERHGYDLPLLVVVVNGFFANREEMCFSTGQVLRLHELRQQRRALVHDEQKKTLSVPLDYTHRFHVGLDTTTAMTIGQICERQKLPVKVRFADPNMRFDCGPDYGTRNFNTLKVIREHNENYFIANSVVQGRLLDTVISIPMYLKDVCFSVVTGVRGRGLSDGGRGLMHALLHAQARDLDFSVVHGDPEMVQLSEKPIKATDNIYQNIETSIYVNVQQRHQPPPPPRATTTTARIHQDRDAEEKRRRKRLANKPCPPLPGEDVAGAEDVTCTRYTDVREEGEPYVNLAQLRDSMSELSSPSAAGGGDAEHYEVTTTTSTSRPETVYYDPDHEEAGVYEPVNMDSARKKGSNPYTSLKPAPRAPSQPSMASELQKALKKRLDRAGAAGKQGEKGVRPGSRQGSSKLEAVGRPDHSTQPGHGEQPFWKVTLKPTKLSMSPKSDSTTSPAGATAGPGGGGGGERSGGSKIATSPSQASASAEAAATTAKSKPTNPNPQIDSAKPLVKKKPDIGHVKANPVHPRSPSSEQQPAVGAPPGKLPLKGAHDDDDNGGGDDHDDDADKAPQQQQQPPPLVERPGPLQTPPARMPVSKKKNKDEEDEENRIYVNEREMAVIAPTSSSSTPPSSASGGKTGKVRAGSQGQVQGQVKVQGQVTATGPVADGKRKGGGEQPKVSLPLDQPLDLWTMDDVTQLLTSLNLARHSADFRDAQVDGKLLQQLTSEMLKEEFSMGSIAIIKLTNFITTGHLPK